jgi:hypothetical protein
LTDDAPPRSPPYADLAAPGVHQNGGGEPFLLVEPPDGADDGPAPLPVRVALAHVEAGRGPRSSRRMRAPGAGPEPRWLTHARRKGEEILRGGGGGSGSRGMRWRFLESFTYTPLKKIADYIHATKKFSGTCVPCTRSSLTRTPFWMDSVRT